MKRDSQPPKRARSAPRDASRKTAKATREPQAKRARPDPAPVVDPVASAQLASPAYRLAALDQDFLLGDSMRGLRFQLEYAKAEEHLRSHGIRSTVVVFGSARLRDQRGEKGRWYREARKLGRLVSERFGALDLHDGWRDNVIATGGGPGIMEAANRGAADAGALSIGFNIVLPHEQYPNLYTTPDLTFRFHYFAMRKMHLAMRANALVVFPGGFGTLDEFFEILTLKQTGKMPPVPIVVMNRDFWSRLVDTDLLIEDGLIAATDPGLVEHADSAEEAIEILARAGLAQGGVKATET